MAKSAPKTKKPAASVAASDESYFLFEDLRSFKMATGGLEVRDQIEPDTASALRRHAMAMRALKASSVQNPYSLFEPKFLHPDFESSPDMLPTRVVYKRDKPKSLSDFLVCQPFRPLIVEKEDEISCFMVSARWRRAIEAVEPNVHHFWPVERVYKDQVVRGYYWLITKRGISADMHMPPQLVFRSSSLVDDEVHVRSRRESLAGHHWAISNHFIVSGTLLEMLRPFFSVGEKRDFKFHPIALED